MVQNKIIEKIKANREQILIGEIGALLHDLGKLHPDFIKNKSVENIASLHHAKDIESFVNPKLIEDLKKMEVKINNNEITIYELIKYHHDRNPSIKNTQILETLKQCDRKNSADDKGIVRKKQHLDDVWISSPFGKPKEKIDLSVLQKRFNDLEVDLTCLLENYFNNDKFDIVCLRDNIIESVKKQFIHALGETRIPANDVTLWDHAYSTAALLKSALASLVLGLTGSNNNLKWRWRIFGISWNGIGFVKKGRKIADIQARNKIITEIKKKLKNKFETEIPIGNVIYEDINQIYFTFPALPLNNNNSTNKLPNTLKNLFKECAEEALKIIEDETDSELWPFFTLSKPSMALTILTNELTFADKIRTFPKMTPTLFIEQQYLEHYLENPPLPPIKNNDKFDLCPICKFRPKKIEEERCNICEKRRKGRLSHWLSNQRETIWIDEVADKNNKIALISLNFNLDKWLNGEMLQTIYSQTLEEWLEEGSLYDLIKANLNNSDNSLLGFLSMQISSLDKKVNGMRKATTIDYNKIDDELKKKKELEKIQNQILQLDLTPNLKIVYFLLDLVLNIIPPIDKSKFNKYNKIRAKIFEKFFENITISNYNDIKNKHLDNIKERLGLKSKDPLTKEDIASYLFTHNPSPARLYRIWNETSDFFDLVLKKIKTNIYGIKWERLTFSVKSEDLNKNLSSGDNLEDNALYLIKFEKLDPQFLLVFHTHEGEDEKFYTLESLEKFKYNHITGFIAIKKLLLTEGISYLAPEKEPDKNLLKNKIEIKSEKIVDTKYNPLIEIDHSPLSLRFIVPAKDSLKIMEQIIKLYNEVFEKVVGKLPLNIKLLVSKRKFPLYVLLDSETRMLSNENYFKKSVPLVPWWNIDGLRNDKHYGFYPTKQLKENERYTLNDISLLSKGKIFHLFPGYFDFEMLLGTNDRFKLGYVENSKIKRVDEKYQLLTGRPYYLYQLSDMLKLWDILSASLSNSQINIIEELITTKIMSWRNVKDDEVKKRLKIFVEATLKDAFGDKWSSEGNLGEEDKLFLINSATNGLLLDTIFLIKQILKSTGETNE